MARRDVRGNVVEIFSGIQGEGIHVGRRQIFLRLAGCDLGCDYCDQPEAQEIPRHALIEIAAGRRDFIKLPNPLSWSTAFRAVEMLNDPPGLHHALTLTGGEPLMQAEFLAAVLPPVRRKGLKVMLETNGTRPKELRSLLPLLDIVSMDFKLALATGRPAPVRKHREFLRLCIEAGIEIYVKAVVAQATSPREIIAVARIILRITLAASEKGRRTQRAGAAAVPLVIQPVTFRGRGSPKPPKPEQVLELQEAAARILPDVRVIPQTHKMIGQR